MKRLVLCCLLVSAATVGAGQALQTDQNGAVRSDGETYIRFQDGTWTCGIEGSRSVRFHMFSWHDEWVYETMPRGTVESGPTLGNDGSITVTGTFSAREGSPPLKYTQAILPAAHGVRVRCELQKTGELPLKSGLWLHLFAPKDQFTGTERVWAWPGWHGTVSSPAANSFGKLLVEIRDGKALTIEPAGPRRFDAEASDAAYAFRVNLLPGDFNVGETAVVEYSLSFEDLPESFPGEIKPMQEKLEIRDVSPRSASTERYGRLELTVDLGATYDNPYDPDDIALDAIFTTPSGKELTVPGFLMVEQQREVLDDNELMVPQDNGVWKVRFAPVETGRYGYQLRLRDRTGTVTGGEGSLNVTDSRRKGFVRQSKADPHYLAFDSGDGYFAIGHNLPIYHTSGQLGDEAMRRFAAARENYNRWWMCSYGFGIEWMDKLGWYRQDAAARIDLSLDVAEELGLYYMMCMDTHQDFRENGWEKNPFNAKNGGPCETPGDWFTNETARELYRKRLRYTVARWGYSPNVLCWEFGNEFEGWANSPNEIKLPWHREMSDYLRSIDPFGHLITTSFWSKTGPEEFWRLPNIDIVQTHCYTNDDANVAAPIRDYCLHQWRTFEKPHVFGEFGIRSHTTTADKDPEGWGIHNALWSGLFSFAAGGPMPWWHESYIDKLDLYFHFTALANFVADLPLGTARWRPLETTEPEYLDPDREPETRDAEIATRTQWGKPEHNEFVLLPDGTIQGGRQPLHLLQGQGHQDLKNPPTFVVDYPKDGQFIAHVSVVSNSGLLRIWVDDELALERELPCGEGLGKGSQWREQWNLWETTYDEDIAVPVPAGRHRIRIENFGKDWVRMPTYTFTGCKVLDKPNLLVAGMKTEGLAMLWLQNRDSSWFNHAGNSEVGRVDPCSLALLDLPNGSYEMEWWETWRGEPSRTETVTVQGRRLPLTLPALETDVAIKLKKL